MVVAIAGWLSASVNTPGTGQLSLAVGVVALTVATTLDVINTVATLGVHSTVPLVTLVSVSITSADLMSVA